MENFDFIKKSNYMDQHMSKPANFTDVKAGRSMRMQAKVEERKSRRGDQFNKNRDIIIEPETSKPKINTQKQQGPLGINTKSQERLKQLQQWKIEKENKKKAAASKNLKPFIVSVVRPPLALFKSPTPVKKSATKNNSASVSDRVTRSGRVDSRRTKLQTQPQQSTFAPPDAKFHPPPLKKLHNVLFGQMPPVSKPVSSQPSTSRNTRSKCNASAALTSIAQKKELKVPATRSTRNTKKNEIITSVMIIPKKVNENNKSKTCSKVVKTRLQEHNQDTNKEFMETQLKTKANKLVHETLSSKSLEHSSPEKSLTTYNGGSSSESIKTPPNQMTPEQLRNEISNMSPFVTMSRGKRNVRNEMLTKLKDGCLSDDSNDQKSAQHFRRQLESEIIRLRQICAEWQTYKDENESIIPQNEQDLIFQAIGQTNLLISKKFEQFRGLVQRCEDCVIVEGEGLVTSSDLQGFWDMVFMQVENLDVRFQNLMELRQKQWVKEPAEEVAPVQKATIRVKRAAPPSRKGTSKIREMIEAARKAAAAKFANAEPSASVSPASAPLLEASAKTFDAVFFKVHSPIKELYTASATPNRNNSLLKEVLSSKARRMSSKKGTPSSMAMMRASYVAKRMSNNLDNTMLSPKPPMSQVNLDATPARSILKTPLTNKKTKEGKKSIKVVLFTQEDQDNDMEEPQPFENLEFLVENNSDSIPKNTDDIPHIINKLDLIAIVTPVVEDVSSKTGKRKSRRKLSRQQAVVCEDVENVPPMEVDHHNRLEEPVVELKRITRSQCRGRGESLTSVQEGNADCLSPPRLTIKTPKNTPKKTPQRTPSRRRTEVLDPSEMSGTAEFQLSPFMRKSRVKPCWSEDSPRPHSHTDLICFDSPAPVSAPVNSGRERRRSTRLASMAND